MRRDTIHHFPGQPKKIKNSVEKQLMGISVCVVMDRTRPCGCFGQLVDGLFRLFEELLAKK